MYSKLINGTPRPTSIPKWIRYNGTYTNNAPDSVLRELGYYKVQETGMPTNAPDGQHYESHLEYTDGKVVQVWDLVDNPREQDPEPTMQDLEDAIKEAINSDN